MKRKLPWGTRRRIGTVIYIAMILAVDIFLITRWVTVRQEKVREVEKLETPREIANHFMREEYNRRWYDMKGVDPTNRRTGDYKDLIYEISRKDGDDSLYFRIFRDRKNLEAWGNTKERAITCIRGFYSSEMYMYIYFSYYDCGNQIKGIWGDGTILGEWNGRRQEREYFSFDISYDNGEYVLVQPWEIDDVNEIKDEDELIEKTGKTVEEMVETAYRDQETMEETMYEMKAYELDYLNGTVKKSMWKKILWTGGISLFLIIIGIISEVVDRWYAE